jgi:hypothetical protein
MMVLTLALLPVMARGAEPPVWEFGLRGGMEATGSEEQYRAGEVYLLRDLPWRGSLAGGMLAARLDLGAGYLEADNDCGGWLAAGADLVWQIVDGMVEVEAGFRPAWLIDHAYGGDDFGGGLQFSSHGGIALRLPPFVISYRYQHLSNAGIYEGNDGLDLHLFGVGAKF